MLVPGMQAREIQVDWLNEQLQAATQPDHHEHLLVFGLGGMGKSYLAEAICHERQSIAGLHTCLLKLPSTQLGPEVDRLLRQALLDLHLVPSMELGSLVTTDVS